MEPDAYSQIVRLRRAVRLSDEVLAAIGCDGEAAEAAIEKLKGWYEANKDTWSARRGDVRAATKALAAARYRLRTGGRDDALAGRVAGMEAAIAAARRAEQELLAGAVREVESVLTESQKAGWSAVRASPAGAGGYAYAPNVTAAQLSALNMAHWKLARQQATAETAAERAAARRAFSQTLANTLSAAQRQALATASANIAEHLPAVLAAARQLSHRTDGRPHDIADWPDAIHPERSESSAAEARRTFSETKKRDMSTTRGREENTDDGNRIGLLWLRDDRQLVQGQCALAHDGFGRRGDGGRGGQALCGSGL